MKLLVSVRSLSEALAAFEGGVDLIDVKEPQQGPLGKASDHIIDEIAWQFHKRCPVSAAMGELIASPKLPIISTLAFVKWGLSACQGQLKDRYAETLSYAGNRAVLVQYADAERANSPRLTELFQLLENTRVPLILFDTFQKDGLGLLNWISATELKQIVRRIQSFGSKVALAGSIDMNSIPLVAEMNPDWIAVRGAACDGGRDGTVSTKRVEEISKIIRSHAS